MSDAGVSICIPTHDGATFLRECIESVLVQSFRSIEVLIVDDHSSDATPDIAREYGARDSRVRVISNPDNLGLVENWNRCVELARGDWIKFVFQDDKISPTCVEKMLAVGGSGAAFVSCARDFVFETGTPAGLRKFYASNAEIIAALYRRCNPMPASTFCDASLDYIGRNIVGEPTSVLFHRSAFKQFGRFNINLIHGCDIEYWSRIIAHTGITHIPDVLATFRVHGGAATAQNDTEREFRMRTLDPLLILHQFAFEPVYAPIRAAASRHVPPLDLAAMFWDRLHWARWHAQRAASNLDPLPLSELNHLAERYPRLGHVPTRYSLARKLRSIKRRLARFGA